jgi:hypothetical protein
MTIALIFYLLVGIYVTVLGYWADTPPSDTTLWMYLFATVLLIVIWPIAVFVMAKLYKAANETDVVDNFFIEQ